MDGFFLLFLHKGRDGGRNQESVIVHTGAFTLLTYGRLVLGPWTSSRLKAKLRTGRGFSCSIYKFLLLSSIFKWQQINLKMRCHPSWFSNWWGLNEIRGVPVTFQWQGQSLPPPRTAPSVLQEHRHCPCAPWRGTQHKPQSYTIFYSLSGKPILMSLYLLFPI